MKRIVVSILIALVLTSALAFSKSKPRLSEDREAWTYEAVRADLQGKQFTIEQIERATRIAIKHVNGPSVPTVTPAAYRGGQSCDACNEAAKFVAIAAADELCGGDVSGDDDCELAFAITYNAYTAGHCSPCGFTY